MSDDSQWSHANTSSNHRRSALPSPPSTQHANPYTYDHRAPLRHVSGSRAPLPTPPMDFGPTTQLTGSTGRRPLPKPPSQGPRTLPVAPAARPLPPLGLPGSPYPTSRPGPSRPTFAPIGGDPFVTPTATPTTSENHLSYHDNEQVSPPADTPLSTRSSFNGNGSSTLDVRRLSQSWAEQSRPPTDWVERKLQIHHTHRHGEEIGRAHV